MKSNDSKKNKGSNKKDIRNNVCSSENNIYSTINDWFNCNDIFNNQNKASNINNSTINNSIDNDNSNNKSNDSSDNTSNGNNNSRLCCFGYVDYIVLASTLAIALGEELTIEDLNILSTFFAVLSDELALIGSVDSCANPSGSSSTFVAPVPDVAMTSLKSKNYDNTPKKRTRIKKIIKKKVKKK